MHECPECGGACFCDGEDVRHDVAPDDCTHDCDDGYGDDDDDWPDDEDDDIDWSDDDDAD